MMAGIPMQHPGMMVGMPAQQPGVIGMQNVTAGMGGMSMNNQPTMGRSIHGARSQRLPYYL